MEIREKTFAVLSGLSGMKTIGPKQTLQGDLGLDSLKMVTLLILLEENFRITLDESDMNPFDLVNVRQVVDLVEKYAGGGKYEENAKED